MYALFRLKFPSIVTRYFQKLIDEGGTVSEEEFRMYVKNVFCVVSNDV